ncbi:MAG: hypothetical protein NC302_09500 [Bacteroidales bacterium]|nr:hypothetical protein [Bacteroidales bacterium]MCM1415373.1 hypothetical protein [bacterium]MCM1423306.1 hypothetical protein [bacterium]
MTAIRRPKQEIRRNFLRFLYLALGIYLIVLLLRFPALSLQYAATGLNLWFQKMIPTLLPFMILSGILIRMNLTEEIVRFVHPLLHVFFGTTPNGSYTLIMGFLCGFPMGARVVGELYGAGKLTRREAERLLAFSNNIGPIYFLSFAMPMLGIENVRLPFLIMYGIPLLYGVLLMRVFPLFPKMTKSVNAILPENGMRPQKEKGSVSLLAAVDDAILSGLFGIAKLGGYMVFFNLLNILFVPFSHLPSGLPGLYNGMLEITSGIDRFGQKYPLMLLILLPFGGFSCIAQTYSMISHTDLSIRPYLFHKLAQTALTALCYLLLTFL